MASIQQTKVVEKSSSVMRSAGSTSEESFRASAYTSVNGSLTGGQSSRVVYSAPISQQVSYSSSSEGAADVLRHSQVTNITDIEYENNFLFGEDAAKHILESRAKEKIEMQRLNDRLAAYLERMRHLESQNTNMSGLKKRWEQDLFEIKQRYEVELNDTQRSLEESTKLKSSLEGQIVRLNTELSEYRRRIDEAVHMREDNKGKIDGLMKQLSETEAEINLLRRRVQSLEDEVRRLRAENEKLVAELQRAKENYDEQSLKSIEYENQVQALLKKMEFLKTEHELEIRQATSRQTSIVDTPEYKNELAIAIREIRKEFDGLAAQNKLDLEAWYTRKVTEIRTTETSRYSEENRRVTVELEGYRARVMEYESKNAQLKSELDKLRNALESEKSQWQLQISHLEGQFRKVSGDNRSLQEKLKVLYESNQLLYAEIAIYRKLLDGEEGRVSSNKFRQEIVVQPVAETVHMLKEEMVTHSSFQRSNKGNIQFADISADGRFIVLENIGTKDEELSNWTVSRKVDGVKEFLYTFPTSFVLKAGRTVKIHASGANAVQNMVDSLVFESHQSWGVGMNATTVLYNREGEEKATYIQTTTTSQRTLAST